MGNRWVVIVLILMMFFCGQGVVFAQKSDINYKVDIPYNLGSKKQVVYPGDIIKARVSIENYSLDSKQVSIKLEISDDFSFEDVSPEFKVTGQNNIAVLEYIHNFNKGYDQWFDLLSIKVNPNIKNGYHNLKVTFSYEEKKHVKNIPIYISQTREDLSNEEFNLSQVILPLDKDGNYDKRYNSDVIMLRDETLDYYKNIIKGKGAINVLAEEMHPICYMGLDFLNPRGEAKLILIKTDLLDKKTKELVPGLFTPGTNSAINMQDNFGSESTNFLKALVALEGKASERMIIPLYINNSSLANGDYILKITAQEGFQEPITLEKTIKIVNKNYKSGIITFLAIIVIGLGATFFLSKQKLQEFKTRHLITTALFGATGFIVVNVPSTFLNDFLHIILGPMSFIVSGMFSGVLLYMLMISLAILIPKPGIITLMSIIRLLINMIAFGHVSPVGVLFCLSQAILLEVVLYSCGVTRSDSCNSQIQTTKGHKSFMMFLAMAVGVGDMISTYVNLEALSFLYRLYYADWYIYMCMLFSGFIYPALGTICGIILGLELKKVGVD